VFFMAKRSKSSDRWLQRQRKDYFVRQAQDGGHISRAHFKLEQIDQRYRIVRAGQSVLELGAAPGGWTHYLENKLHGGLLIAVDPLPITCGHNTHVIEGLAGDAEVDEQISRLLDGTQLDLVLSDMAPNITGIRDADEANFLDIADAVLEVTSGVLRPGGGLILKMFQFPGTEAFIGTLKKRFTKIARRKPPASRKQSKEFYVVGIGYKL